MKNQEKIREILNPLLNLPTEYAMGDEKCFVCGFPLSKKEREEIISQTITKINKVVMESVPRETTSCVFTHFSLGWKKGWNEAIAKFKKNWEGTDEQRR